ncbi:MAG: signal peptidase II [Coriobacteriales bacterium]|nr:signal peptidase II [Coriobacteriales bacterium]
MEPVSLHGRGFRICVFWVVVILVVACDQATKAAMIMLLEDGPRVLIPGIMNLVHVENTGAAFSMGEGAGPLFVLIALVFLAGAAIFVWRTDDMPLRLAGAVGLVAGGGIGNMIDRIMNGSVTDFFATAFIDFPVFNVADICVTVGIVCVVIGFWLWDGLGESDEPYRSG